MASPSHITGGVRNHDLCCNLIFGHPLNGKRVRYVTRRNPISQPTCRALAGCRMSVCEVLHTSQRTIFGRVLRCLEKPSAHHWLRRANLWRKPTSPGTWSERLSDISLKVMWKKQRTSTFSHHRRVKRLMELKLDDATEFVAALTGERHD